MCTATMVCHGDDKISKKLFSGSEEDKCKPATFYITNDGRYAIHTDLLTEEQINDPNLDISSLPKVELKTD